MEKRGSGDVKRSTVLLPASSEHEKSPGAVAFLCTVQRNNDFKTNKTVLRVASVAVIAMLVAGSLWVNKPHAENLGSNLGPFSPIIITAAIGKEAIISLPVYNYLRRVLPSFLHRT